MVKDEIKDVIVEMIVVETARGNFRNAAALNYALRTISKERPRYAFLEETETKKLHCTNCGKKYKPHKATPYCGECGCKFLGLVKTD